MRNYLSGVYLLFSSVIFVSVLFSCDFLPKERDNSEGKGGMSSGKNMPKKDIQDYKKKSEKALQGLEMYLLKKDTLSGVQLMLGFVPTEDIFESLQMSENEALYYSLKISSSEGIRDGEKPFERSFGGLEDTLSTKLSPYNLSKPFSKVNLPWELMRKNARNYVIGGSVGFHELPHFSGEQNLDFDLEFFRVKTEKYANGEDTLARVYRTDKQSLYELSGSMSFFMPVLYETKVFVKNIRVNEEKASQNDFTIFGSGYPDLYWRVSAAGRRVFRSLPSRNRKSRASEVSKPFYARINDKIGFEVMDRDVMSRDDLLLSSGRILSKFSTNPSEPEVFFSTQISKAEVYVSYKPVNLPKEE